LKPQRSSSEVVGDWRSGPQRILWETKRRLDTPTAARYALLAFSTRNEDGHDMQALQTTFNNRELAALIWISVLAVLVLARAAVRRPVVHMMRLLVGPKLLIPLALLLAYMVGVVFGLWRLHLWMPPLLKDTIVWFVVIGLANYVNITRAMDDERFFSRTAVDSIKVVVFLEFLVNLYVFPLWVELIFFPFLFLVTVTKAYAEVRTPFRVAEIRILSVLLILYGLVALSFSVYHTIAEFRATMTLMNLRQILLQPVLTLALLPFVYALALYASYELTFVRIEFSNRDTRMGSYLKRRLIRRFGVNLFALNRWGKGRLLRATNASEAEALLRSEPIPIDFSEEP